MTGGLGPDLSEVFPLGAAVTVADLEGPGAHSLLHELRAAEPVSWLPALGGWLVTRHDLALAVMRDSRRFTVDDPRFTTAQVVGPSMLSLDGAPHRRHRDPFSAAFRGAAARSALESLATQLAYALVQELKPADGRTAELRRGLAGPLAVAVVTGLLGLPDTDPAEILAWYDKIVTAVTALSAAPGPAASPAAIDVPSIAGEAGQRHIDQRGAESAGQAAFGELSERVIAAVREPGGGSLLSAAAQEGGLTADEIASDAAVLMFGGIETTEGMICNAVLHLLSHPAELAAVRADPVSALPAAVAESLRLEPAAAVVDRYATAGSELAGARIRRGDLVRVSIAAANRDPAVFARPDDFDPGRPGAQHNLGFARGPHFCPGAQLAAAETAAAVSALLDLLPGLRLDPARRAAPRGLVFRKPPELHVRWDAG